jgi:hypothetical protein
MSTSTTAVLFAADVLAILAVVGYLLRGVVQRRLEPVAIPRVQQTTKVAPALTVLPSRAFVPAPRPTTDAEPPSRAIGKLFTG